MSADANRWPVGPCPSPPAAEGEVHVWRAPLEPGPNELESFRALLDGTEVERAERFRFEHDRVRYVAAHGALRLLLSGYLGVEAGQLRFDAGAHGKPYLADSTVRFNLSHSAALALIAVTSGREVGCDVEAATERPRTDELAARFFSAFERDALAALPAGERHRAFFDCWARKEAFIKARGEGLSLPLHSFDVTVTGPARLVATRPDGHEAGRWQLVALDPAEGFAGAVCVAGAQPLSLHCWSVPWARSLG